MLWIADHRVGRQEIYQGNPSHATTPELRNDHKALQMGAYALRRYERRQTNECKKQSENGYKRVVEE